MWWPWVGGVGAGSSSTEDRMTKAEREQSASRCAVGSERDRAIAEAVRERLALVEAERDAAEHRAESLYTDAKRWNEAMAELAEARQQADHLASQLALAMAWGAEVCGMLDETEHAMHMRVRGEYDRTIADSWRAKVAEVEQRAERAEAERDALLARLGSPDTHPGIAWQSLNRERDDARERAQEAECEVQSWKDECGRWEERVGEVEAGLLDVTAERDEARACWHRDVAKGRAAIEKREADLAAARAQLAAVVAAVLPCSICHGLGVYATACSMCGDSTYEHECDDKVAPCPAPACGDLRRALADTAQAAREHDERVRAEERERCAKVCEAHARRAYDRDELGADAGLKLAERIRAIGSRS